MGNGGSALAHQLPAVQRGTHREARAEALGHRRFPANIADVGGSGYLDIVPLATPLEFKREGLQSGVLDKLRRGKYSQQASLSLLRQPVEQCRQMLFAFMVQAQKEGLRNVLIVHGKGRDDQSHANIIRSYLARWLEELPEVQAFCAALPHHGGSGACYVALRKSAQAKQETWEQHAKRSR